MMIRHNGRRAGTLLALVLCVTALAFAFAVPAGAQDGDTLVKVSAAEQSIDVGEQFEVQVTVENVEHLASFAFDLRYDPSLVQPVQDGQQPDDAEDAEPTATSDAGDPAEPQQVSGDDIGQILATSERSENIICEGPAAVDESGDGVRDTIRVFCVTASAPVCLGGPEGASGSGVLASLSFEAMDSGKATLEISNSTLTADDVEDCDIDSDTIEITHALENATIELKGGSIPWRLIGIGAGVVVAVLVGGALVGLAWYKRRSSRLA